MGYVKRIGVRCHSSNMMLRLLQRYILYLFTMEGFKDHEIGVEKNLSEGPQTAAMPHDSGIICAMGVFEVKERN